MTLQLIHTCREGIRTDTLDEVEARYVHPRLREAMQQEAALKAIQREEELRAKLAAAEVAAAAESVAVVVDEAQA